MPFSSSTLSSSSSSMYQDAPCSTLFYDAAGGSEALYVVVEGAPELEAPAAESHGESVRYWVSSADQSRHCFTCAT